MFHSGAIIIIINVKNSGLTWSMKRVALRVQIRLHSIIYFIYLVKIFDQFVHECYISYILYDQSITYNNILH